MMRMTILVLLLLHFGTVAIAAVPKIEMVSVKGGCFRMGDIFDKGQKDEKPVHQVCVDDFSMGKYVVTQGEWQAVMGNNPSSYRACGANCPVEHVSWEDAQNFISRLNKLTGRNYRLPYEAEWEYAARSGGMNELFAGTNDPDEIGTYAWYMDNSDHGIHPVGSRRPNGLGLYDMSGNVWQWCNDWYGSNYYEKSPKNNPHGPLTGNGRVGRGGSFGHWVWNLRTTIRTLNVPDYRDYDIGFRLVLPVGQ